VSARTFRTNSEEETIALGRRLARELSRPALVQLVGNLGAGKTTLAKGIVDGLGVTEPEEVSSPTFTLIHDYGQGVFHIDLYRLETEREVASLGLEELFDRQDAIVLIEWGERFRRLFPSDAIEIEIRHDGDSRNILVTGLTAG
jgi:tRNA threonylcarbamoyladenosine biosynthesis protein TsaE